MQAVKGRYDDGWEQIRQSRYERQIELGIIPPDTELPPNNPDVPDWSTLSPAERRVAARLQEAYAAFVEHTDAELARLVEFLERTGEIDNTVIIITSDNGAAMEGGRLGSFSRIGFFNDMVEDVDKVVERLDEVGGPSADSHYATGWAQASNTPLRWYKYHTHGGGIRDPLIVSWGDKLAQPGAVLDQFHHIIDIAPTIYELAGVEAPAEYRGVPQMPMHGESLAYTFSYPDAPTKRRVQYFEMFGNRGIWADGWKAVTRHFAGGEYRESDWELYDLDNDFSEAHNLADEHPDKVAELAKLWWQQAGVYDVLPLDDRSVELFRSPPPPGSPMLRPHFDYYPPVSHVEPSSAPPFGSAAAYRIEVQISRAGNGVLVGYGNSSSGFVLYLDGGRLYYEYNSSGDVTDLSLDADLDAIDDGATVAVNYRKQPDGAAVVSLEAAGRTSEFARIARPLAFLALAGMDIGADELSPVSRSYAAPFPFDGVLDRVRVSVERGSADPADLLDD